MMPQWEFCPQFIPRATAIPFLLTQDNFCWMWQCAGLIKTTFANLLRRWHNPDQTNEIHSKCHGVCFCKSALKGNKVSWHASLPPLLFLSSVFFQCIKFQESFCDYEDKNHILKMVQHQDSRSLGLQWYLGLLCPAWIANHWNSCYIRKINKSLFV